MTQVKSHEPLLRIAKRDSIARPKAWAIRIVAVLLSLVVSGVFIFAVTKLNPIAVYEGIFDGAFGTPRRSWVTVRDAMMLLCIGVGLAPAFKMRFWNIGAEGQVLIGGIVTAGFMRAFGGDIPTPALLVIMAVVSLLAGQEPLVQLLSGGLMLGAIFMATDYVTSPYTLTGKLVYGLGLGIITCAIRFWATSAEGVSYAILLMNLFVPYINDLTRQKPLGGGKKK